MDLSKPIKGAYLIERKLKRKAQRDKEQAAMQAAVIRDGRKCRNPRCTFKALKLPVDPAHAWQHRQMGGNPTGDRTSRQLVFALCRGCHGEHGAGVIQAEALDVDRLTDGPLAWYRKHAETGVMEHYATEKR